MAHLSPRELNVQSLPPLKGRVGGGEWYNEERRQGWLGGKRGMWCQTSLLMRKDPGLTVSFPPFKKPQRTGEDPLLRSTNPTAQLDWRAHLTQSYSSPSSQPFRSCSSSSSRKLSQIAPAYSYPFSWGRQWYPLLASPVTSPILELQIL